MSNMPPKNPLAKEQVLPLATHLGTLVIGNAQLPCAVLKDGTRLFTQEGLLLAIGRAAKQSGRVDKQAGFFVAQNLLPFVSKELIESTNSPIPFRFRAEAGKLITALGHRATILGDVCFVYLDADEAGALRENQKHIAEQCRRLVRGFVKEGIERLVDRATGYAEDIDAQRTQVLLAQYVLPELRPWVRTFPEQFFREVYRLYGWKWTGTHQHPQCVGGFINRYVYSLLPAGILQELQAKSPTDETGHRAAKLHQGLTGDIGHPHLRIAIGDVITLMALSNDVEHFRLAYETRFGTQGVLPGMRPPTRTLPPQR